mgnify:CR=1 FL=1
MFELVLLGISALVLGWTWLMVHKIEKLIESHIALTEVHITTLMHYAEYMYSHLVQMAEASRYPKNGEHDKVIYT